MPDKNFSFNNSLADKYDHAQWIEGESMRAFMPPQQQTQVVALIVIPVVTAVLYPHVHTVSLLLWTTLSLLLATYRWRLTDNYSKHLRLAGTASQLHFRKKHAWTWPATALLWSALVWIFFAIAPLFNQLVCFVILASIGVFSATGYATHLKIMKQFINTLMISLLCAMLWRYLHDPVAAEASLVSPIFALQLIFWKLLILIGGRLHQSHLQGLELRKGNDDLILSLQEQTRRANQAVATKNRMLASAAHDIRQPVLALELYASMLKSEPEFIPELTDKLMLATKSVINMFDSLFDLARIESNQIIVNKSMIHVPELMHELDLQYRLTAEAKKLEFRLRSKQLDINTDHQLLKRILGNLIMNAIKFTDQGGVLLACRKTQDGVRFEVWDTGVGIPSDQQEAVFREFYKASSNEGTSDGFGLGLSIVARFCESLQLGFYMRSRVNHGSVFCVEIPTLADLSTKVAATQGGNRPC
jgi:signal transduction histidine kinase